MSGTDDALQADIGEIEELVRTLGASTDPDALTSTLDAFGEDDPMAAALLRAQRANARHKARLNQREEAGEPEPEVELAGSARRLDGGAIQADGAAHEEGGSLATALRQAKQAHLVH
ncbi:hypothetical protein QR78_07550 [Methylobacterium indicum]|nr:hypothetical protein QR78_07550 [Methylobacterium indicum]